MDTLPAILIIYGAWFGLWTLVSWIDQLATKRDIANRAQKGTGLQPPEPASKTQQTWGCLAVCGIVVVTGLLHRANSGVSRSQPSSPVSVPVQSAASPMAVPITTPLPRPTLESLQRWYDQLTARKSTLVLGDTAALRSFNEEAARYTTSMAAYVADQNTVPTESQFSGYHDSVGFSSTAAGEHHVNPYIRRGGTVVAGHYQTNPDNTLLNNYSTSGNINPHTGRVGTVAPGNSAPTGSSRR